MIKIQRISYKDNSESKVHVIGGTQIEIIEKEDSENESSN